MRRAAFALALAVSLPLHAAEIDSVTARNSGLGDSVRRLNARVNGYIREGVERANREAERCDEEVLYEHIRKAIASPFIGHSVAQELDSADNLDVRRVRRRESVYRDLGFFDAVSVHLKDLSSVMRLRDHLVGVDKLGHFLVEGWKYFEIAYLEGEGIEAALAWGERTERTYFGFLTTGVYSYADLAVNFDGMRFWLRILGRERDPLEKGYFFNRPYVSCSRRFWSREPRWKVKRKFDLGDYVTGAWDEGVNCSAYRNEEIEAQVRRRVEEREELDSESYTCPIDPDPCAHARERYGRYADALLHSRCAVAERRRSFLDIFR